MDEKELFNEIANHATKNERIAWKRKQKKLETIIAEKISPIEDEILRLTMEKQTHMDEVVALREIMVKECVHPAEFLVRNERGVVCKFCLARLRLHTNV